MMSLMMMIMSLSDELGRNLLEEVSLGKKEITTGEESMPQVLSGLGETLATISTAILKMEKSIKSLQSNNGNDTFDANGGPRKRRSLASQPEEKVIQVM